MRETTIEIEGIPATKGNLFATASGKLRPSHGKKLTAWTKRVKAVLREYAGPQWREHEPVEVEVHFRFQRPASHSGRSGLTKAGRRFPAPTGHGVGDGDKLTRALWDCLKGPVLADDSQIAVWSGSKRWCDPGERPGCTVIVRDAATEADA